MAAMDKVRAVDHVARLGLHHTPMLSGIEAASQSWKRGAVLILSSGKIAEAAADPVTNILGIALAPATGTTDAAVQYVPALPHLLFEATFEDQANGDHALARANVFGSFALQKTAGGLWFLDENDTTNVAARLVEPVDAIGTVQGRVRFAFLASKTVFG